MNGDYIILGQTYSTDGDIKNAYGSSDIAFARISSSGDLLKLKNIGGLGFETPSSFIQRPDGTFVIVGHQNSQGIQSGEKPMGNDVSLYYTLPNGNLIKSSNLGGDGLDEGKDLSMTKEGETVIVGSTQSNSGDFINTRGDKDIFIAFWH